MVSGAELWRASARGLADLIRTRQASSREVVQAHLQRIEAVNGAVNAVTVVLAEEALAAATAADAALASGAPIGPLHGVPVTVKENIDLVGSATTHGSVALSDALPPGDAPHIAQLKVAGAIPIGRTNVPDFALRWHTDSGLRGLTRNPWNPMRSPGGSSGGDAVAIATGMTPLGVGNDYGGSLRVPSQFCGVAAIRPTLGRVAWVPLLEPQVHPFTIQHFWVQGPMARHIEDVRIALEAMSGPDPRDPRWVPAPAQGPSWPGPVPVAFTMDPAGQGTDQDVAAGVRRAAAALRDAGYQVEEVEPPDVAAAADTWAKLVMTELRLVVFPRLEAASSADAVQFLRFAFENVPPLDLQGYMEVIAARFAHARAWSEFQARWPLVLGPVYTQQPWPLRFDTAGREEVGRLVQGMRLVVVCNLLGLPAASVPVGVAQGLPQGVQIIGPRYREDLCLNAAQAIEDRLGAITPIGPRPE